MISEKDLILITSPSEIPISGAFYRKEPDGTFSRCLFEKSDLSDPMQAEILKYETAKFCQEKRLFKNRHKGYKRY